MGDDRQSSHESSRQGSKSRKSLRASTVGIKRVPASVQLLENRLQSHDEEIRIQAYTGIFKLGAPSEPLIDKCEEQLHHENWYVREAGVNSLAHCIHAGCGLDAMKAVFEHLEHAEGHMRHCAAETLVEAENQIRIQREELRSKGAKDNDEKILEGTQIVEHCVNILVRELQHNDPKVRQNALQALGRMDAWCIPHATTLCALVTDENLSVRNEFLRVLKKLNTHLLEGLPILAASLENEEEKFRRSGTRCLMELAQHAGSQVAGAVLEPLKREKPRFARMAALECFAALGHISGHHGKELSEILEERDPEIRMSGIHAMICAGKAMQPHYSHIKRLTHDHNADVSRAAVQTLRGLAPVCPKFARGAFKDLEEEPDLKTRMMAIEVLGGAGHNAHAYLEELAKALEDKDWTLRRLAIEALADLQEHAEPAASEVARRLLHAEPDVRRAAAEALGRMGLHSGEFGHRVEGLLDTEEDLDVKRTVAAACEMLYAAGMEKGH